MPKLAVTNRPSGKRKWRPQRDSFGPRQGEKNGGPVRHSHLDKGGAFLVKQQDIGSGHWEVTSMDVQMNVKVLIFKTIAVRERETYSHFRKLPDSLTLRQALAFLQEYPSVQMSSLK
jgi:hypothetical protein